MDIKELKEHKAKLETDITEAVYGLFEQFKTDTGVSPSSINICIRSAVKLGEKDPYRYVKSASVDIEI